MSNSIYTFSSSLKWVQECRESEVSYEFGKLKTGRTLPFESVSGKENASYRIIAEIGRLPASVVKLIQPEIFSTEILNPASSQGGSEYFKIVQSEFALNDAYIQSPIAISDIDDKESSYGNKAKLDINPDRPNETSSNYYFLPPLNGFDPLPVKGSGEPSKYKIGVEIVWNQSDLSGIEDASPLFSTGDLKSSDFEGQFTGSITSTSAYDAKYSFGLTAAEASLTVLSYSSFQSNSNYDLATFADLAGLSMAAYETGATLVSRVEGLGWSFLGELDVPTTIRYLYPVDAHVFAAQRDIGGTKELVISFEGTNGAADLITDFTSWGFTNYYKSVRSAVTQWLEFATAHKSEYSKIFITGHKPVMIN